MKRIVLIAGFESFNANLYRQAANMATARCEGLEVILKKLFLLNSRFVSETCAKSTTKYY